MLRRHFYGEQDELEFADEIGFTRHPGGAGAGMCFRTWGVEGSGAPGWRLFRVVQTAPNRQDSPAQQLRNETRRRRVRYDLQQQ